MRVDILPDLLTLDSIQTQTCGQVSLSVQKGCSDRPTRQPGQPDQCSEPVSPPALAFAAGSQQEAAPRQQRCSVKK